MVLALNPVIPYTRDARPTIAEWVERSVVIPPGNAAPGPVRLRPFQRDILAAYADPAVRDITLMLSSQSGKTELCNWMLLFSIANQPDFMMMVQPNLSLQKRWKSKKFDTALKANPSIRVYPGGRSGGAHNQERVTFPGGHLEIAIASSERNLRGDTARCTFADEIDVYQVSVDAEDPVDIIRQRSATYRGREKMVWLSTPIDKGASRIDQLYQAGSRSSFWLPCPHCRNWLLLLPEYVLPVGDDFLLHCPHCGDPWTHADKLAALEGGEWRAANPEALAAGRHSYHLNQFYAPHIPIGQSARELAEAREISDQRGDNGPIRAATQQILAIPFQRPAIADLGAVDKTAVLREVHPYADFPDAITIGVDVQGNRLEASVLGWYSGDNVHVLEHRIIPRPASGGGEWDALADLYRQHRADRMLIDRGAFTDAVTEGLDRTMPWELSRKRVATCKGDEWEIAGQDIARTRGDYVRVGTSQAKDLIADLLLDGRWTAQAQAVPPGYVEQLTSERKEQIYKGRVQTWVWRPRYNGIRNEALDCAVYGVAARRLLPYRYSRGNPTLTRDLLSRI